MEATIAKIRKNATAEIWISLTTFPGRQVVDIREYFLDGEHHQWRPTKKGIMVEPDKLPHLIDGIKLLENVSELGTVATLPNNLQVGYRENTKGGGLRRSAPGIRRVTDSP
jgi:Transcriptional Coactivator p15 (PC4)